jgi:hypothetical protein
VALALFSPPVSKGQLLPVSFLLIHGKDITIPKGRQLPLLFRAMMSSTVQSLSNQPSL